MRKLDFDPARMERISIYKIVAGAVVPRPIGLISTAAADGHFNVAPFSFFNVLSSDPPYLAVSMSKHVPDGRPKDTLRNILDTGEFVANIVSEDLAKAQDACSEDYPPEIDEFQVSGLTPAPSVRIGAPTVLESRVNFECRLFQAIPLPKSTSTLVLGEVVHMRVAEEVMDASGRVNLAKLAPVGRIVGNAYCHTRDVFTLQHDAFDILAKGK